MANPRRENQAAVTKLETAPGPDHSGCPELETPGIQHLPSSDTHLFVTHCVPGSLLSSSNTMLLNF